MRKITLRFAVLTVASFVLLSTARADDVGKATNKLGGANTKPAELQLMAPGNRPPKLNGPLPPISGVAQPAGRPAGGGTDQNPGLPAHNGGNNNTNHGGQDAGLPASNGGGGSAGDPKPPPNPNTPQLTRPGDIPPKTNGPLPGTLPGLDPRTRTQ